MTHKYIQIFTRYCVKHFETLFPSFSFLSFSFLHFPPPLPPPTPFFFTIDFSLRTTSREPTASCSATPCSHVDTSQIWRRRYHVALWTQLFRTLKRESRTLLNISPFRFQFWYIFKEEIQAQRILYKRI